MATSQGAEQYVKYTFYKIDPQWRRLNAEIKEQGKQEFTSVIAEFESKLILRTYSTVGMRGDADIMIWSASPTLEALQEFISQLLKTTLGAYLETTYSYLAMTRRSTYVDAHEHKRGESKVGMLPMSKPYLFVYPFVKTHAWYQLPFEERQRMMNEHFKVGHEYPSVKIHTSYSFGLDDQEFVLGFETNKPADFLELVMAMRSAEQRPYTEKDVPIFTCLLKDPKQLIDIL